MYKDEKTTEEMIVDLLLSIMDSKLDQIINITKDINISLKSEILK